MDVKRAGAVVVMLVILGTAGFAQDRATLSGNVVDTTGGRLPGVTVTLARPGASPVTVIANATGRYDFVALPPATTT